MCTIILEESIRFFSNLLHRNITIKFTLISEISNIGPLLLTPINLAYRTRKNYQSFAHIFIFIDGRSGSQMDNIGPPTSPIIDQNSAIIFKFYISWYFYDFWIFYEEGIHRTTFSGTFLTLLHTKFKISIRFLSNLTHPYISTNTNLCEDGIDWNNKNSYRMSKK